jgi:hypothetical protein
VSLAHLVVFFNSCCSGRQSSDKARKTMFLAPSYGILAFTSAVSSSGMPVHPCHSSLSESDPACDRNHFLFFMGVHGCSPLPDYHILGRKIYKPVSCSQVVHKE